MPRRSADLVGGSPLGRHFCGICEFSTCLPILTWPLHRVTAEASAEELWDSLASGKAAGLGCFLPCDSMHSVPFKLP